MKPFIAAVIAAIAIGFGASLVLSSNQQFAYEKFSTSGVRLSEPGTNLVGHEWTGDPKPADFTDETREKAKLAGEDAKRS